MKLAIAALFAATFAASSHASDCGFDVDENDIRREELDRLSKPRPLTMNPSSELTDAVRSILPHAGLRMRTRLRDGSAAVEDVYAFVKTHTSFGQNRLFLLLNRFDLHTGVETPMAMSLGQVSMSVTATKPGFLVQLKGMDGSRLAAADGKQPAKVSLLVFCDDQGQIERMTYRSAVPDADDVRESLIFDADDGLGQAAPRTITPD